MRRRDISGVLLASIAGTSVLSQSANAQTSCSEPCYPLTEAELDFGLTLATVTGKYPPGDVRRYGATASNPVQNNKQALQTAISTTGTDGGTVLVPAEISYGYLVTNPATYPDFSNINRPVVVMDYGPGNSYGQYPISYDGSQVRMFFHTPQTTSPGQHDGNGLRINGAWHPYYGVNNTSNLAAAGAPSRTSMDNRRASLGYFNDGQLTYRLGQGTLAGANYTDDQLSNFVLEAWDSPAVPNRGVATIFLVDRLTGHVYFNTDSNASDAAYHFKTRTPGYAAHMVESLGSECLTVLRNSNGNSEDVRLSNRSGDFAVTIPTIGDALVVSKADRHVWIPGHLRLGNHYLWVDSTGKLRVKSSPPTSDTDGVVVGTQS